MTIHKMKINFLGQVGYVFRVFTTDGELVACCETQAEAESFVNAK